MRLQELARSGQCRILTFTLIRMSAGSLRTILTLQML
jgi:hypothetical protein